MAYNNRTDWKDLVVARPKTYTETTNSDGSKTFKNAFGETYQNGTPQSAANFNKIEEALQHISNAYDMMEMIYQAQLRDAQDRIEALEAKVSALSSS